MVSGLCGDNEIIARHAFGELVERRVGQDQIGRIEFLGVRSQHINWVDRLVNAMQQQIHRIQPVRAGNQFRALVLSISLGKGDVLGNGR